MSSNSYHSCAVRECNNTSIKTPGKLWIKVPSVDTDMRKIWLNLARRDPNSLSPKSPLYFCEDHFDLENDMENYMQYKIMGSVRTIRMKPKCVPSKFDCQVNPKPKSSKPRRTYVRRQQMSNIQEIDNQDLRDIHNIVNKGDKGVQVFPVQEHKAVQINVKVLVLRQCRFAWLLSNKISSFGQFSSTLLTKFLPFGNIHGHGITRALLIVNWANIG